MPAIWSAEVKWPIAKPTIGKAKSQRETEVVNKFMIRDLRVFKINRTFRLPIAPKPKKSTDNL